LGNLALLLPLGIYLPLLYKKMSNFFVVSFLCMLVSIGIELLQLVTSFRSTDIDDVFLNTIGAGAGFIIYSIAKNINKPIENLSQVTPTLS
jgi:glycopeptide antibiotics resistance protein